MRGIYVSAANFARAKPLQHSARTVDSGEPRLGDAALSVAASDSLRVSRARVSPSAASSLTRCEPRCVRVGVNSDLHSRESLATRGAAYEDTLTLLPTSFVTAAARSAASAPRELSQRAGARRAPLGFPVSKLAALRAGRTKSARS